MSDRVYASILYLTVITGGAWIAVTIGEALTREALTQFALIPSSDGPQPSRVDAYIAAQDRAPALPNVKEPLIPVASSMPAGALARAMDEAERVTSDTPTTPDGGKPLPEAMEATMPAAQVPEAVKPRVAGWVRRIPKRAMPASAREESSGRIIVRSLRAEM